MGNNRPSSLFPITVATACAVSVFAVLVTRPPVDATTEFLWKTAVSTGANWPSSPLGEALRLEKAKNDYLSGTHAEAIKNYLGFESNDARTEFLRKFGLGTAYARDSVSGSGVNAETLGNALFELSGALRIDPSHSGALFNYESALKLFDSVTKQNEDQSGSGTETGKTKAGGSSGGSGSGSQDSSSGSESKPSEDPSSGTGAGDASEKDDSGQTGSGTSGSGAEKPEDSPPKSEPVSPEREEALKDRLQDLKGLQGDSSRYLRDAKEFENGGIPERMKSFFGEDIFDQIFPNRSGAKDGTKDW